MAAIPDIEDFLYFLGRMTEARSREPLDWHRFHQRPLLVSGLVELRGEILDGPKPHRRDVLGVGEVRAYRARIQKLWVPSTYIAGTQTSCFSELPGVGDVQFAAASLARTFDVPVSIGIPKVSA
ncbi:hypothetical protein [Rhodococcus erythropolis]|uniref:hypothetical protein n=1 Tax=Rhodococcus erythropolis TaxID=1833 RepID=UPI00366BDE7D